MKGIFDRVGHGLYVLADGDVTEGVVVRIYSAAKTVADCFKFRNKIGLDMAIEALRDYRQHPGFDTEAL